MNFIKSHWKLLLIAVAVVVVAWQWATGATYSSKLWNMVRDQIAEDRGRVIDIQQENMKWYEETILSLQKQLDATQSKLGKTDAKLLEANKVIDAKEAEIFALRRERETIITPTDPDGIIDALHKLGYGTEHRRPR